jgi:hypothetical protein
MRRLTPCLVGRDGYRWRGHPPRTYEEDAMTFGVATTYAPLAATLVAFTLAVLFTRIWVNDTAARAVQQLKVLGMRPGRHYKLGGAWARLAARDGRNATWASLALVAWVGLVVAVDVVRR